MFERQYGGVEDHSCLQDSAAAPFSYPCAFVTRSSFGWASNGTMATQLREVQQSCDVSQILSTAHPGIVESCTSCTIRRWRQPRRCVVERSGSCGKCSIICTVFVQCGGSLPTTVPMVKHLCLYDDYCVEVVLSKSVVYCGRFSSFSDSPVPPIAVKLTCSSHKRLVNWMRTIVWL